MILDGNSKVGEAKVWATVKEMNQEKEIEKLRWLLHKANFILDRSRAKSNFVTDVYNQMKKEWVKKYEEVK